MRRDSTGFRFATAAALGGLLATTALTPLAQAQTPPPSAAPGAPDQQPQVAVPERVGAITALTGQVSFHGAGDTTWDDAVQNFPVTSGNGLWTQPDATARIDVSATRMSLAGSTNLEVTTLNGQSFIATLPQGEVFVQVGSLLLNEGYTIVTPRGSVSISAPGQYDIVAGDTSNPSMVAVLAGQATLGDGATGAVGAGQAAQISGDQAPFQVQTGSATPDAFVTSVLNSQRAAPTAAPTATSTATGSVAPVQVAALVTAMPGGGQLSQYGAWQSSPQYGQVWYPQVASSWAPYRQGHWAYVAPWGWTWVDDAPWGFAPFHYGRWVDVGGRWGWTPGSAPVAPGAPAYPVYAPALVTFFGVAVGAAVGITAAMLARGSVGWVPLGPQEVYRPWFNAGPNYIRNVNVHNVTNVTEINNVINNRTVVNNATINNFANRRGATLVPAAAMATSRPIGEAYRPITPEELAQARPVVGRQVLTPTTATMGVTPAVARQVHAVPPPAGTPLPRREAAPGPVIRAQATPGNGVPPRPQVAPPPAGGAAHPGQPPAPGQPGGRPAPASPPGNAARSGGPAAPPVTSAPGTPPRSEAPLAGHTEAPPAEHGPMAPARPPAVPAAHPAEHAAPDHPAAAPREIPHPVAPAARPEPSHPAPAERPHTQEVHPPAPEHALPPHLTAPHVQETHPQEAHPQPNRDEKNPNQP
jgi:hypothetical protein